MIQHPVFLRCQGEKTIIVTIVDTEDLGLPVDGDMFIVAGTSSSIYSGNNPTITLDNRTLIRSKAFLKTLKVDQEEEPTEGNSIEGILRMPIWFVKKCKSILEQMGM